MEEYGIRIKVEMPTQDNMDEIINKIKKYMDGKININVNVKNIETEFKKVKDQVENIKKSFNSISKGSFDKQSVTFIGDEAIKSVTEYTDALGKMRKIINTAGKETVTVKITDNTKILKEEQKIQEKLLDLEIQQRKAKEDFARAQANFTNKAMDDNTKLSEQTKKQQRANQENLELYKLKISSSLSGLQSGKLGGFVNRSAVNDINDVLNGTKQLDTYTKQWIDDEVKGIAQRAKLEKELFDFRKKNEEQYTKLVLTNEEKINKALNTRMQSALKVEVGATKLSPESEVKIQNQLNRYKNIIKSFQEKNNLGIQTSDDQIMKLQNIENRIKRYSETLKIAEKDSQGFSYGKFEKFNQLSSNIKNAGNSQEYFNKSILEGYHLLQAQVSETENYIRVTQKLRQGSEIRNIGVYVDKNALQQGTVQAYKFSDSIKDLKTRTYDMGSAFLEAYRKITLWAGATGIVYGIINGFQQMWQTIVKVNTEITELSKVLSNDTDYGFLMSNLNMSANYYARSLTEAQAATLEFAKQGYEAESAINLANAAMLGANVTGMKTAEVAERLTGVLAQFNLEASKSSTIIDKVNEVDNNFAVTSVALMQGIQKSGEAAQQFGVDLDTLIGYITAVQTSTRESGNVIGNAFKTMFSRVEMEPVQTQLEKLNIAVKETSGDLRPVADIYEDLALKWNGLNREAKMQTATLMAGRFHITRFMSLMDNWNIVTDATTTSQKSLGSAIEENYKHQRSLESQINRIKSAAQEFSVALGSSGVTGAMGVLMNSLVLFTKGLTEITTNYNGAASAIGILTLALFLLSNEYKKHIVDQTLMIAGGNAVTGMNMRLTISFATLKASLISLTASVKAFSIALLATPMGWITLIISAAAIGIPMWLGKIKQMREEQQMLNDKFKESNDRLNEIKGNVAIGIPTLQNINDLEAQIQKLDQLSAKIKEIQNQHGGNIPIIELPKEQKDYLAFLGIDVNKLKTTEEAIEAINNKLIELNNLQGQGKQISSEYFDFIIKRYYLLKDAIDKGTLSTEEEKKARVALAVIKGQLIGISDVEIAKIIEENGVTDEAIRKIRELIEAKQEKALVTAASEYEETSRVLEESTKRIALYEQEITKLKDLSYYREKQSIWEKIGNTSSLGIDSDDATDRQIVRQEIEALEQAKWYEEARQAEANTNLWNIINAVNNRPVPSGTIGTPSSSSSSSSDPIKEKVDEYKNALQQLDSQIELSKAKQELLTETSEPYKEELQKQIDLLKLKQETVHQEAEALRAMGLDDNNEHIIEAQTNWSKFQKEINDLISDSQLSHLKQIFEDIENSTKPLENSIKQIKDELSLLDESQVEEKSQKIKELATAYDQYTQKLQDSIFKLQQESSALDINSEAYKQNQDEILSLQQTLESIVSERQHDLKSQLQSLADQVIDIYKDFYQKQIDLENDRHDKAIDALDKELDKYEEIINAKLKLLEDQEDEEDYNKNLSEKQQERQEILNQINVLSLDNSLEARTQLTELNKELSEKDEEIEEIKSKRSKDLQKENLKNQLDIYKKDVDAKKKTEDEKHEITEDGLESLKNDEVYFLEIRRQIMDGHLDQVEKDFAKFGIFLDKNMEDIGSSISTGLIDKMKDVLTQIISIQDALEDLADIEIIPVANSSIYQGHVNYFGGDQEYADAIKDKESKGIPFDDPEAANAFKKDHPNLFETGGSSSNSGSSNSSGGSSTPSYSGHVDYFGGEQNYADAIKGKESRGEPLTNPADAANFKKDHPEYFHKGGIVGEQTNTPPKIVQLANKLLNTNADESLIVALKNEVFSPQKNIIGNFIPNIQNLINSISTQPVIVSSGDNIYNLNLKIDNLTGDRKGAEFVFNEISKGLKKLGV